jgi:hypothetical protein
MADLTDPQSAQSVKVIGADATGVELYPVASDDQGNLFTKLKDSLGQDLGTETNPIYTTGNAELISPLPSLKARLRAVISSQTARYSTFSIATRTAIKEFHVGGRLACEGYIAKYVAATTSFISGGNFEIAGDLAQWTDTSVGDSVSPAWSITNAQAYAGSFSATKAFSKSDQNNYPELTYTYSSPQDWSSWRYIHAAVRVSVASGGSQTRTVSVRVRSGTSIRSWQITGTTVTAPFSSEQWLVIQGELEAPDAISGTGAFDINNVDSISLRLQDGGNKTGTIYWDDVRLIGAITILDKIYSPTGQTTQLILDPVEIFETTDTLLLTLRNNDAALSSEFEIVASGVDIT